MLDRTGALIGEQCSSCYHEGVPLVVVVSVGAVKNFQDGEISKTTTVGTPSR